jgi:hypothetical protein
MNSHYLNFDANFSKIVSENFSIASVIRSLGRAVVGSNYTFVKTHVQRLNLDTSHWLGMKHGTSGRKQIIIWEKILVENSPYHLTTSRKKTINR